MSALPTVSIFRMLDQKEMDQLAQIAQKETFPANKAVFFEGDRSEVLYFILSGSVRVYQTSEDGKERTLTTMGSGRIFGEMAMLDGKPRSASVATNEETVMLVIGHTAFRALCAKHPDMLWKVMEALCDRIRQTTDDLLDMSFRDVPYRLIRTLVNLAHQHGERRADGLRIDLPLTSAGLAGMVGSTADRVSRLLDKFEDEKVLRREGEYLVIADVKSLERSLEYEKDWA